MKNKDFNGLKMRARLIPIISFAVAFGYFFSACASSEIADSGDVNQEKIYQYYSVTYDANSADKYNVEAQFRFGGNKGTTLRLTDPSKVYVNGEEMNEETQMLKGCYYKYTVKDKTSFEFKFVDTEEKEYKNSCKIYNADLGSLDDVYFGDDYEVVWRGPELKNNEKVTCTITDSEGNSVSETTDIVGGESVKFDDNDLESLVEGKAEVSLIRTMFVDADETAEEGGKIYTEYKSENKSIKIKK